MSESIKSPEKLPSVTKIKNKKKKEEEIERELLSADSREGEKRGRRGESSTISPGFN